VVSDEVEKLTIEAVDRAHTGPAELNRVDYDRVEDGLYIRLGAADHAQDLAGRRLLLQ
jgi:hypothetical protein